MYKNKTIAVVVPAYNEELLIGKVIETMPDYVDKLYVVDDCSTDKTVEKVKQYMVSSDKVHLLQLEKNRGPGAALVRGYKQATQDEMDVVGVMDGDAQMDPDDLINIISPVVLGEADYVKGNRLFTGEAWKIIPRYRYFGNSILSLATKISSGYWHISDSQTAFTAISRHAIETLPLDELYPQYGYPNHMLTLLNVHNFRVRNVPIRPIYDIGEKSGIQLWKVIPRISSLLIRNFIYRMTHKYMIRDFHPLVFFYFSAFLLFFATIPLAVRILHRLFILHSTIPPFTALALVFCGISGMQAIFFAMWFDIDANKHLR